MEEKRKIKIKVEDLTLIFGKRKQEALALLEKGISKEEILKKTKCTVGVNKVSFEIMEGEIFVIMGLSGSGKSTLIRCLNRLNEPTSGKVFFDDHDITRETNKELLETRRTQMSMVFQKFGLLPHRTIIENAAFGLEIRGEAKEEREEKALQALETVGLKGYEYQYPSAMSGGMQDELLAIQNKLHKTIVFITHDLDEAMKIGDRIAIMKDGVVEQTGTAEEILTNPATEYIEAFVNKVDRKTIITAESLMFKKITLVQMGKDGPKGAIRKMSEAGVEILPVEDEKKRFIGYVWLQDLLKLEKEKVTTVEKVLRTNVPSVYKSYSVEDMLPLIIGTKYPLAVIEEATGKLLGLISQTSLIIEATRFEKEEISELKERANEM
jgi:glycine betaine/proline transport system ATP-binding protein